MSMTPEYELLHLAAGAWELEVQPPRGGAIMALRHRGREVLVSPGPASSDAIGTASFALVPYANRIAHGQLPWGARSWTLPRNHGDHPHALHGTGWKRPWSVATQAADSIELNLRHEPDEHWPWAFTARQRIVLQGNAVRFELDVTNAAAEPAPMGVGFHPAFAACARTRLRAQVEGVWLIDEGIIPVSHAPADAVLPELPGAAAVLRETLVDHYFTRWSRQFWIDNAGSEGQLQVAVAASPGMEFLHLYMPPGRSWFCAEPVSQMPDAVHHVGAQDTGLRVLAPGESMQVWMTIAVEETARV